VAQRKELKTAFVDFVLINLKIVRTGGILEQAITVACCLGLEGITREELLRLKGDARAEAIDFHAETVATAGDPNVTATRQPLRFRDSLLYYYCGNCGTPLKVGKCRCRRTVPDIEEFRNNQDAPKLPYRAWSHITHKGRYIFSTAPQLVETKRKPRGEINRYW
jgi:hypothetical protein